MIDGDVCAAPTRSRLRRTATTSTPHGRMRHRLDDELVSRAKEGDPDAWRDLHRQHAVRLRVWLQAMPTGDPALDADDVAASAWLTTARRIDEFTGSSSDFGGWLFAIARNVMRTTQARSSRRATHPVDHQAADRAADRALGGLHDDPAALVAGTDLAIRLVRCLPRREAEAVACLDLAGLDVATTARLLGISQVAVRVSHHRAITRLRSLLGGPDRDPHAGRAAPRITTARPTPRTL